MHFVELKTGLDLSTTIFQNEDKLINNYRKIKIRLTSTCTK